MRQHRLVVGAAVAALVVVLAAAAEGLTSLSGRTPSLPGAPLPTTTPTTPPPVLAPGEGGQALDVPGWVGPALVAALVVLAVVVFVLVVVRLLQRRRSRAEALDALDDASDATASAVLAPAVRRGIARSLEVLEEPRDLDDAVVRAWTGLEETAEDAGLAREPAETPTEFTARLLSRVPADREAVEVLRELYARARFGSRTGVPAGRSSQHDDDDAARARAALRALARSWDVR